MPRDMSSLRELSACDISKYQQRQLLSHRGLYEWIHVYQINKKPKRKGTITLYVMQCPHSPLLPFCQSGHIIGNIPYSHLLFPISYDLLLVPCFDFVIFCCNSAVHIKQKDGTKWFDYPISIWYSISPNSSTIHVSKGPKSAPGLPLPATNKYL